MVISFIMNQDRIKRSRGWVFTINNYTDDTVNMLNLLKDTAKNITHMIVGAEEGEQGTKHLQGYIRYNTAYPRNAIAKRIPNAYLDIANAGPEKNHKYCTKQGKILIEHGDFQSQSDGRVASGDKIRHQYQNMWEDIKEGATEAMIGEKYPQFFYKHLNSIRAHIVSSMKCLPPWDGDLTSKNKWIYGPTGCGKSKWAHQQVSAEQIFFKNKNKWWDGYDSTKHKVVLIEDFLTNGSLLENYIKIWADRYSFTAEVKGGTIQVHPSNYILIITSNHSIHSTFSLCNPVDVDAINRRFNEIEFDQSPLTKHMTIDLNILNK